MIDRYIVLRSILGHHVEYEIVGLIGFSSDGIPIRGIFPGLAPRTLGRLSSLSTSWTLEV